jgi:glutamate-1-semialdehyde 2,1-aminomutase
MIYPDPTSRSAQLYERAKKVMPAGNSRLTVAMSPYPIYIERGEGYRVWDVDGVERIDCVNNMTSLIHGHRHPDVSEALAKQAAKVWTVAAPTEPEIGLAEILTARVSGVDKVRFCNSGTEAVMFAIRAARAFTGRSKVAKAEGAYNGASDPMATGVMAHAPGWGDSKAPVTMRDGIGVAESAVEEVITFPFNDIDATRDLLRAHGSELAAVVLCPLPSRMKYPIASPEFAAMLREVCTEQGIMLILDEVMSFRLGYGGSQDILTTQPDIVAFAKIIGGGLPVGAFGGRSDIMDVFDHTQGKAFVLHGGTYNANPLSMAAGEAALKAWTPSEVERLNGLGERFRDGMRTLLRNSNIAGVVGGAGSLCAAGLGDSGGPIQNYRDYVSRTFDPNLNGAFYRGMLNRGVMFSEGGIFILSTPMTEDTIDHILDTAKDTLKSVVSTQ